MNSTERKQLSDALRAMDAWAQSVWRIRWLAFHQPLGGPMEVPGDVDRLVDALAAAGQDIAVARVLPRTLLVNRKKLRPAHEAATRVLALHTELAPIAERLGGLDEKYRQAGQTKRDALDQALHELGLASDLASSALTTAAHLPFSRTDAISDDDDVTLRSLVDVMRVHDGPAADIAEGTACTAGNDCADEHASARLLFDVHREAQRDGVLQLAASVAEWVEALHEEETSSLPKLAKDVATWPESIATIQEQRRLAPGKLRSGLDSARQRSVVMHVEGRRTRVIPLNQHDSPLMVDLLMLRDLQVSDDEQRLMDEALGVSKTFTDVASSAYDNEWRCTQDSHCAADHDVVERAHTIAPQVEATTKRLSHRPVISPTDLDNLLDPSLNVERYLPKNFWDNRELMTSEEIGQARSAIPLILDAESTTEKAAATAQEHAERVRKADIKAALVAMDLDTIRKAAPDRGLRLGPLLSLGLENVYQVLEFTSKYDIATAPGLGPQSARAIHQAVRRLYEGVREETPVRIDVKRRLKTTQALLHALRSWDAARRFVPTEDQVSVARGLEELFKAERPPTQILVIRDGSTDQPPEPVMNGLRNVLSHRGAQETQEDVWTDFLTRPADYFGMLTELGFITEDAAKMHGDLPTEIIEAVREAELRRDHLTASLRTYQSFGARFALVQEKVVIGDEMGLGKTVEALALLAHLRATGHTHFLVVCPAAVVSNWIRECGKHTTMKAHRLHGPLWERNSSAKAWLRMGDVAVTTFDLLPWLLDALEDVDLSAVIFDEAHYIKNPQARRSMAATEVIDSVKYAVLMTGTPLENRVQEFRNLIGYIRPDLGDTAPEYMPSKFRRHVAPAYLRRNQEDVLTELPGLVEVDEWMGMSTSDAQLYEEAVREGRFMAMRRAAMQSEKSLKVERLLEIVREAEENGRRVIVYSYFRDVVADLARILPGEVFGPLTGSTPAVERQRLVDHFSESGGGAVLVAQIAAGGVGLNIQAASVVVICEPQVKPTLETQAIARAHRMGQTNTVQVHRLLTENSVDERIRELLADKQELFDQFARDSEITERAPEAVDMSDAELARQVIAAERERLHMDPEAPSEDVLQDT